MKIKKNTNLIQMLKKEIKKLFSHEIYTITNSWDKWEKKKRYYWGKSKNPWLTETIIRKKT